MVYSGKTGELLNAFFDIYEQEGMLVTLETIGSSVCGTVHNEHVYACDLPDEIGEELFFLARERWQSERRYVALDPDNPTQTHFIPAVLT